MSPDDEIAQLQELARRQLASAPPLSRALEDVARTRYHFRQADGRHVEWSEAARRGYAACGEAAAYLAAAAAAEGRAVELALVTGDPVECGPGYRHAVAVVDGVPLDVYAGRACPAPAVPLAVASLEGRTMEAGCGCRAAGLGTYQRAVQGVCGVPAMPDVLRTAHALVRLTSIEEASEFAADIARQLGLDVDQRQLDAVWNALDGLLTMCDQARAAGWQGDTLRGTATAIDIVAGAAIPLHAAGVAIGASGFLVEVVGVTVTAAIGGTIVAVVAACQILEATGVTDEMRAAAAELDQEDAPSTTPPKFGSNFPRIDLDTGGKGIFQPIKRGGTQPPAPAEKDRGWGTVLAWAGAVGTAASIIALLRGR